MPEGVREAVVNGFQFRISGLSEPQWQWLESHSAVRADARFPEPVELSVESVPVMTMPHGPTERVRMHREQTYLRAGGEMPLFTAINLEGIADHHLRIENDHHFALAIREGELAARTPLRVLRMISRSRLLERRGVLLHASMCCIGELGLLFVGSSGTGKTSISLQLSKLFGASLVSSDRTVLGIVDSRLYGFGGPELHRLGLGLVESIGDLHGMLRTSPRFETARPLTRMAHEFASKSKYECTSRDLAQAGITSLDSACVSAVVVLNSRGSPTVETTSTPDWGVIDSQVLHPDASLRFPLASTILGRAEAERTLREYFKGIKSYRVTWDRSDPSSLLAMLSDFASGLALR